MRTPIKYYLRRYKVEISITVIGTVISAIVSVILYLFPLSDSQPSLDIIGGTLIIVLLLAILFNLRRLLSNMIANLPMNMDRFDPFKRDKYWERLEHFAKEKDLLAEIFVDKVLPRLINDICSMHSNILKLNIILDSGTTITPIFKNLVFKGIKAHAHDKMSIVIFTNNLAGIEEIHKIDSGVGFFHERDFNLIGGKPLNAYRATTGPFTQHFLNTIWAEHDSNQSNDQKIITLAVVTANWITCGSDFKRLNLVAKGEGHLDFKKDIILHSHYLVVISPLGKLLPLEDFKILNDLPRDEDATYQSYTIPDEKKISTLLLTSLRPPKSSSPLYNNSLRLADIRKRDDALNYKLCQDSPTYQPAGDHYGVTVTEVPHQYIRDNFEKVFLSSLK